MGRPAFLYGSPVEWDTVKGCLLPNYARQVRSYKEQQQQQQQQETMVMSLHPNIVWKWYRYSNNKKNRTTPSIKAKRRLLIAQYSGFGSYSRILQEVLPVNLAYAQKWGHDFVTLEGTALQFPGLLYDPATSTGCPNLRNGYESQSTFNKIPLLFEAMKTGRHNQVYYDQVLILDTDTMIVNFDYDITTLLLSSSSSSSSEKGSSASSTSTQQPNRIPSGEDDAGGGDDYDDDKDQQEQQGGDVAYSSKNEYFLAAYKVWWNDWPWTWDVNAGITLWNLHHPTTKNVAEHWLHQSMTHPHDVLLKNDDQFFLQRSLMKVGWYKRMIDGVKTVRSEFEYYDGTLVKHFKRDARSWSRTSLEQRLLRIQEAKHVVCDRWPNDCQMVQHEFDDTYNIMVKQTTSKSDTDGDDH
jgi:hypothetical protein